MLHVHVYIHDLVLVFALVLTPSSHAEYKEAEASDNGNSWKRLRWG